MLNLPGLQVPLVSLPDGCVRVDGTGVLLEQVVADFEGGANAEEIVGRHAELRLSDVFLVLSFYLKNRKDVEAYLSSRQHAGQGQQCKPKPAA